MNTVLKRKQYKFPPEEVFDILDDLGVSGIHMTGTSMTMMGSKLQLTYLTQQKTGLYTRYRWFGKVLWWNMDFTVRVVKWEQGREKIWETVGRAELIIYSWFRMRLTIDPCPEGSIATVSISYQEPSGAFKKLLCSLLGDYYCKWCLNNMLDDAEKKLNSKLAVGIPA
jgi:hypothetical protein